MTRVVVLSLTYSLRYNKVRAFVVMGFIYRGLSSVRDKNW